MKTKSIKFLSLLLTTLLILGIFSGCDTNTNNTNTENNDSSSETETVKWVLTHEKSQYSDEFSDPSIYLEKEYRYDSSGRLIYEKQTYEKTTIFTGYDYKYDDNGNVISKSMKETAVLNSDYVNYSNWTYQYDANGNCIKETVHWLNDNSQDVTDYEYDDKGNVIKEHFKNDGVYSWESTKTYTLTYENGNCIQEEILNESTDTFGTTTSYTTSYMVYQYEYDANGNKTVSRYYTDIDSMDEAKNPVQINGRHYKLYSTTYYTYEKLADVATDAENSGNTETTTSVQTKLSASCDKVLASGSDPNGDFYELVANESETYEGVVVKVGVIKNNKWIVEMTSDMPLVDSDKTLYGTSISGLDSAPKTIYYIGNNCFLYRNIERWGSSGKTYQEIIYNFENGKSHELIPVNTITTNFPTKIALSDDYAVKTSDNGMVIWQAINYDKVGMTITFLDTTTMETSTLNLGNCGLEPMCHPLSDDWFAVTNINNMIQFYDTNGNMVLDLSEYKLADLYQVVYFEDGLCYLNIKNNSGTKYQIAVNKNGEVVKSVEF